MASRQRDRQQPEKNIQDNKTCPPLTPTPSTVEQQCKELTEQLRKVNEKLTVSSLRAEKQAEKAEATSRTLRVLLDTLPAGVLVTDERGDISLSNAAAKEIFGGPISGTIYSPHRGRSTLYHLDGSPLPPEELPLVHALQRGESTKDFEILLRREGGRTKVLLAAGNPIRDAEGRIIGAVAVFHDITERYRAEVSLSRLASIVESAEDAIVAMTLEGIITDWNPGAERLYGYSAKEILGKPVYSLVPPHRRREPTRILARIGRGERVGHFETERVRKDGKVINVLLSASPIKDRSGKVVGASWLIHDITDLKQTEQELRKARDEMEIRVEQRTAELAKAVEDLRAEIAERRRVEGSLRESEARFRKLFEEGPLGMSIVGLDYRFLKVNPRFCQITGYSEEELTKLTFLDIAYPEELERDLKLAQQLFAGEIPYYHHEKRYIKKNKDVLWIDLFATVIRNESGRPLYALAMIQDITERKRADQEHERLLREVGLFAATAQRRANELETVIRSIADGVFVCDKEGRIVDVNEAALKMVGLASRGKLPKLGLDYLHLLKVRYPDGKPIATDILVLSRALRGEVVVNFEELAQNVQTKRDLYLLVSAAPIRDVKGNISGAVEVMSDISQLKELDKLKDEFITVAAHELKTPIAIMKGYAQALLRSPEGLSPPRRRMLDAINRGSDRIDRIVRDLLDISRLHLGHLELTKERIDLPELVQEVVDRMALTTPKHHLKVVRAEPVVVSGDRSRIEQVLINLLDNAIKYSPRGGNIDIAVDVEDHGAVVSVNDYGVGIPKEKQRHIFERFYSAHTGTPFDYGGMGVGLYISREIISRHGGKMWFTSEEGKGSTFYFSLPLSSEQPKV